MASEDLGAPAYRKFDVEAWMPGLERFGEVFALTLQLSWMHASLNFSFPLDLKVLLLPSMILVCNISSESVYSSLV